MISPYEYISWDGVAIRDLLNTGQLTAREIYETALSLARILNPHLNAIVTWMEDLAERRLLTSLQGPFAGVPTLLKDLDQPLSGARMTGGSRVLKYFVPDFTSEFVERMNAAGMVIFGKTNVPEFGLLAYTEPELFGPCRNPWDLERTPGGSSGGSAAAVAAGIVPFASASDGGGSIRIPAAYTGLVGLKPSRGRTPTGPHMGELWQGFAVNFFLTRTVRDAATLLDLMAPPELGAPFRIPSPVEPYSQSLHRDPPPLKIALCERSPLGTPVAAEYRSAIAAAGGILESLGHCVEEVDPAIPGDLLMEVFLTMYYGEVSATIRFLMDQYGSRVVREIEPITASLFAIGESLKAGEFIKTMYGRNFLTRKIAAFLHRYDLLVTPTVAVLPPFVGELAPRGLVPFVMRGIAYTHLGGWLRRLSFFKSLSRENFMRTPFTQIANIAGIPALSLPLFLPDLPLPLGIQFLADFGREEILLQIGRQWEEAQPWAHRYPPPPIRKILEDRLQSKGTVQK